MAVLASAVTTPAGLIKPATWFPADSDVDAAARVTAFLAAAQSAALPTFPTAGDAQDAAVTAKVYQLAAEAAHAERLTMATSADVKDAASVSYGALAPQLAGWLSLAEKWRGVFDQLVADAQAPTGDTVGRGWAVLRSLR